MENNAKNLAFLAQNPKIYTPYVHLLYGLWPRDDLGGRPQTASDDLRQPQ